MASRQLQAVAMWHRRLTATTPPRHVPEIARGHDTKWSLGRNLQQIRIACHEHVGISCYSGCQNPFVVGVFDVERMWISRCWYDNPITEDFFDCFDVGGRNSNTIFQDSTKFPKDHLLVGIAGFITFTASGQKALATVVSAVQSMWQR